MSSLWEFIIYLRIIWWFLHGGHNLTYLVSCLEMFLFLTFWLWWNIERFSGHVLFGFPNVSPVSFSMFRKFSVIIPLKKLFVSLDFKSTPSNLYSYSLLLGSFGCAIILIFLLYTSQCIIIPIFSSFPEMCSSRCLWRSTIQNLKVSKENINLQKQKHEKNKPGIPTTPRKCFKPWNKQSSQNYYSY